MTDINTDTLRNLGLSTRPAAKSKSKLGQQEFLKLMITQIQNQDPFKPLENGEFISQMAQFGTVSGIQDLQNSFASLSNSLVSNQALQASSLVGRSILVESGKVNLVKDATIEASAVVDSSASSVTVDIVDFSNQVVKTIELGPQSRGLAKFTWDGTDNKGQTVAPGQYGLQVKAVVNGKPVALGTMVTEKVESVTFGSGQQGLLLNTVSKNSYGFNQIKQVK